MLASLLSLLATASVASAQSSAVAPATPSIIVPASPVSGNPPGVTYVATLPTKTGSAVRGYMTASSNFDGTGVRIYVTFSGLPDAGMPYIYHIHASPVPSDGNCTGAGAHLDPYKRGEMPLCDSSRPETCQVGDLSGKHGNVTFQNYWADYAEPYLSTTPGTPAFFGDLSFVIHTFNKTRIACANFALQDGASDAEFGSMNTSMLMKPSGTDNYPAQVTTNSATKIFGSTGALFIMLAAFLL